MSEHGHETKKQIILEIAEELDVERFTPAEVEQIRRQLVVRLGAQVGKTSPDYITEVLEQAGLRVARSTQADSEGMYEEEFHDLLHFATLEEAEMCLVRLDELLRKFRSEGQRAAAERVLEVARLGRRRSEMIARNPRVDAQSVRRSRKSWNGSASGWKLPKRFLTGWMCASNPPTIAAVSALGPSERRSSARVAELQHRLEVESLDLGDDVRAVGLELLDPESREPVTGREAASIWAALMPVLAGGESWAIDFFAHLDRVSDFCRQHSIAFREPNSRALVIPQPPAAQLAALFERFAAETFGVRAGGPLPGEDAALEADLARRGVDGYHPAFPRYLFCAVCDFEGGFLTVLSQNLWASEIMRRARAALEGLHVEVARPA